MNQVALLDLGVLIYFMRVTAAHRLRLLRSDKCNVFFLFYYCLAIILHVSSVNTATNKSRTISEYRIANTFLMSLSPFYFISFIIVIIIIHTCNSHTSTQRRRRCHHKASTVDEPSWALELKVTEKKVFNNRVFHFFLLHHKHQHQRTNNILTSASWNGELFICSFLVVVSVSLDNIPFLLSSSFFIFFASLKFIERRLLLLCVDGLLYINSECRITKFLFMVPPPLDVRWQCQILD